MPTVSLVLFILPLYINITYNAQLQEQPYHRARAREVGFAGLTEEPSEQQSLQKQVRLH